MRLAAPVQRRRMLRSLKRIHCCSSASKPPHIWRVGALTELGFPNWGPRRTQKKNPKIPLKASACLGWSAVRERLEGNQEQIRQRCRNFRSSRAGGAGCWLFFFPSFSSLFSLPLLDSSCSNAVQQHTKLSHSRKCSVNSATHNALLETTEEVVLFG